MILVRPVQAMQRSSLSLAPKGAIAKVTMPAGCSCSIVQVDDNSSLPLKNEKAPVHVI